MTFLNRKSRNVCCYDAALDNIARDFRKRLPVYVRGIASTRNEEVTLVNFTEVGNDAVIRNISEVLRNGTELSIADDGSLIDRPDDLIDEGIITRVASLRGHIDTYLMMVKQALRKIEEISFEQGYGRNLVPTLLIYDFRMVTFLGGVNIALPQDLKLRQKSLLRAYLLDSVDCQGF